MIYNNNVIRTVLISRHSAERLYQYSLKQLIYVFVNLTHFISIYFGVDSICDVYTSQKKIWYTSHHPSHPMGGMGRERHEPDYNIYYSRVIIWVST